MQNITKKNSLLWLDFENEVDTDYDKYCDGEVDGITAVHCETRRDTRVKHAKTAEHSDTLPYTSYYKNTSYCIHTPSYILYRSDTPYCTYTYKFTNLRKPIACLYGWDWAVCEKQKKNGTI